MMSWWLMHAPCKTKHAWTFAPDVKDKHLRTLAFVNWPDGGQCATVSLVMLPWLLCFALLSNQWSWSQMFCEKCVQQAIFWVAVSHLSLQPFLLWTCMHQEAHLTKILGILVMVIHMQRFNWNVLQTNQGMANHLHCKCKWRWEKKNCQNLGFEHQVTVCQWWHHCKIHTKQWC